jgi:hypothetical protein
VDGSQVALEDQGARTDGCSLGDHDVTLERVAMDFELYYDCLVRDRAGNVIASMTPNRPDGTCDQP